MPLSPAPCLPQGLLPQRIVFSVGRHRRFLPLSLLVSHVGHASGKTRLHVCASGPCAVLRASSLLPNIEGLLERGKKGKCGHQSEVVGVVALFYVYCRVLHSATFVIL